MYINRRSFIRIISFFVAAILLVGGLALCLNTNRNSYKRLAQNAYLSDFDQLSEHMYNISVSFLKSSYSQSPYQLTKNAAKVWGESMAAKVNLENLSGYNDKLSGVSKYLSQAGDYMMYAALKSVKGETLSEDEYASLLSLAERADALCENITSVSQRLNSGEISCDEVLCESTDYDSYDHLLLVSGDLVSSADQISGYPELIYDGPFSDHIERRESEFLKDKPEIPRDEAMEKVSSIFNIDKKKIEFVYENDSPIPVYAFSVNDCTASVSKNGGYLVEYVCPEISSSKSISTDDALKNAEEFLKTAGYSSMTKSYYYCHGNELTVNFNYSQNGVVIYPDMIKINVSLSDGSITGFEAVGYLMAHTDERDLSVKITDAEASKAVNPRLNVISSRLSVIPTDGKNEVLCHEFTTETKDKKHVLVYINANTGVEEMLQILMEDENGTLCS